jgi:hypothetical protein
MQSLFDSATALLEPWFLFVATDPMLRFMQGLFLLLGAIVVFLVFFTTRDILLRTRSFLFMLVCIVLVAILPVIGFLIYLLIRPARTLRERVLDEAVDEIRMHLGGPKKSPTKKKSSQSDSPKAEDD